MREFTVDLRAGGALTQLPDSQKIFGALVYMFSDAYGSEAATELAQGVLNRSFHLALSNIMPAGCLPVPQDYLIDRLHKGSARPGDEGDVKSRIKEIKERSYLKEAEIMKSLARPSDCKSLYPYISLRTRQRLRAFVRSARYGLPELESKLYSVPTVDVREISRVCKEEEQETPVANYEFRLQLDEGGGSIPLGLLKTLEEAAEDRRTLVLGKRASQGLNTFELCGVREQPAAAERAEYYLNMGMLLPDEIDFTGERSALRLFTSERRPFDAAGGWGDEYVGKYISFIAEGSVVRIKTCAAKAGKSIPSPYNKRDIVFGNAYLYPISFEGADKDGQI